jgi:hypothetical protein
MFALKPTFQEGGLGPYDAKHSLVLTFLRTKKINTPDIFGTLNDHWLSLHHFTMQHMLT